MYITQSSKRVNAEFFPKIEKHADHKGFYLFYLQRVSSIFLFFTGDEYTLDFVFLIKKLNARNRNTQNARTINNKKKKKSKAKQKPTKTDKHVLYRMYKKKLTV